MEDVLLLACDSASFKNEGRVAAAINPNALLRNCNKIQLLVFTAVDFTDV